jgi:hypothetical protein
MVAAAPRCGGEGVVYKRQVGFGLQNSGGFYRYLIGMALEVSATVVLMGVGLLISILGFYLWK